MANEYPIKTTTPGQTATAAGLAMNVAADAAAQAALLPAVSDTAPGVMTAAQLARLNASAIAGILAYYPDSAASTIGGGYKTLSAVPIARAEATDVITVTAGAAPVSVAGAIFATDAGVPGITSIPAGDEVLYVWASVDSTSGRTTVLDFEFYKRVLAGTETLLHTITTPALTASIAPYVVPLVVASPITLLATDRIVIKVVARRTVGTTQSVVTWHYNGSLRYTHVDMTLLGVGAGPAGNAGDFVTLIASGIEGVTPAASVATAIGAVPTSRTIAGLPLSGDITAAAARGALGVTSGLDAARPAAGTAGAVYFASDTGLRYVDTSSAWRVDGQPETIGWASWAGGSGKLTSAIPTGGAASGPALANAPCTWAAQFYLGTVPGASQRLIIAHVGSTGGWQIAFANPTANRIGIILYGIKGTTGIEIPTDLVTGWHTAAFAVSDAGGGDTLVAFALDGAAAGSETVTGTYEPPAGTLTCNVGAAANHAAQLQADTELYGLYAFTSALSGANLSLLTASPSTGRLGPVAGVSADMVLRPDTMRRGLDGTWVSQGLSPRVWTLVGSLTTVVR